MVTGTLVNLLYSTGWPGVIDHRSIIDHKVVSCSLLPHVSYFTDVLNVFVVCILQCIVYISFLSLSERSLSQVGPTSQVDAHAAKQRLAAAAAAAVGAVSTLRLHCEIHEQLY